MRVYDDYRKFQEKFKLPHLSKLQEIFQFNIDELSGIDQIRDEISKKLFDFTENVIEPLIWCTHHCHAIEREMLTKSEYRELLETYKKIQSLRWKNNLLILKSDSYETAKWIAEIIGFWKDFEPLATKLCYKFSNGWANLKFKKEVIEYHG